MPERVVTERVDLHSSLTLSADELYALTGLRRSFAVVRYMKRLGAPAYVNQAGQAVVPRLWFENWCRGEPEAVQEGEYNVRVDLLPGGTSEPPAHPQRR